MAAECITAIKSRVIRVTRLDTCGDIVGDPIVSSGFVSVEVEPEYEEGSELVVRNANDELCVNEQSPNALKRMNLTIRLCCVNPELVTWLAGVRPIIDEMDDITGFAGGELDEPSKFVLEVWQDLAGNESCEGGVQRYVQHIFPWVENGTLEGFTLGNEALQVDISAVTRGNPNYGSGPFGSWVPPLDPDEHYALQVTTTAPPQDPNSCLPGQMYGWSGCMSWSGEPMTWTE